MKRLMLMFLSLAALAALSAGSLAASASASGPTVLFLGTETFPVEFNSLSDHPTANTILSELQTTLGTLNGKGLLLKITLTANATGTYETLFLNVVEGTTPCKTSGDAEGEVLIPSNTFELVYDALASEGTLGVGTLFKLKKLQITCGKTVTTVEGSVLGLVTPLNLEVNANSNTILGSLRCKNASGTAQGTPSETSYWNSAGTLETAKLEANLGVGTEKACQLIELTTTGTIVLLPSKMVELMG